MAPGATVRFESLVTPGRYFTGRVVFSEKDYAIVRDIRDNERWKPSHVKLGRLEYVKPIGKFR